MGISVAGIIQRRQIKCRFTCGITVIVEKKGDVTGASAHEDRQKNSPYGQTDGWYIYKAIHP